MVYSNLIDVTRRISFYVFLKRSKNFKNYQYRFICKQYLIQYSSIYPKKRGIVREKGTNYPTCQKTEDFFIMFVFFITRNKSKDFKNILNGKNLKKKLLRLEFT